MSDNRTVSLRTFVNSVTQPCNACCPWRFSPLEQEDITNQKDLPVKSVANQAIDIPMPKEEDSMYEKMIYAVKCGDAKSLQDMFDNANEMPGQMGDLSYMNQQFVRNNERNACPVELACTLGHVHIVHVYLDNGCSPNLPTTDGRLIHSVLHYLKSGAIHLKDGQILIKRLCDSGCNVNIKDIKLKSTLLYASELGNIKIMEMLLDKANPVLLTHADIPNGFTALHMSAMRGDLDCVLAILKHCNHGSVVNLYDSKGNTPLGLALKAMNQTVSYMNNLVHSEQNTPQRKFQMENLSRLQHNSVAIVEALLDSGTKPDSTCCMFHSTLYKALTLVNEDETSGVLAVKDFSKTIQFTATQKMRDIKKFKPNKADKVVKKELVSPYTGIVRLLVLHGFRTPEGRLKWLEHFGVLHDLVNEIFDFVENTDNNEAVLKLTHLSKQAIRNCLAANQNLHLINKLSLPAALCAFIKLQVF